MSKIDVIAIDGPSGAGKSSVAKEIGKRLGYEYISTGAMYRLIGLLADENGIFHNEEKIKDFCEKAKKHIDFKRGRIFFKNSDYTDKIYENRVSMLASDISKKTFVREILGTLQREIGLKRKSVLEGRDIGTVIFPDAKYKFFLDASPKVRAERRYQELVEKGENIDFETIYNEIVERDRNDSTREMSPLKKADDAVYIDTSNLSLQEVVSEMISHISEN